MPRSNRVRKGQQDIKKIIEYLSHSYDNVAYEPYRSYFKLYSYDVETPFYKPTGKQLEFFFFDEVKDMADNTNVKIELLRKGLNELANETNRLDNKRLRLESDFHIFIANLNKNPENKILNFDLNLNRHQTEVWTTSDNRLLNINTMSSSHVRGCIAFLKDLIRTSTDTDVIYSASHWMARFMIVLQARKEGL